MKILLVNNCHNRRGGADTVYLNTAEMFIRNGHDVVFFSIKDKKNLHTDDEKYFVDKKVEVDANLSSKFKNLIHYFYNKQASKNIEKLIEIEKPDIAHIHLFYGGITPSILSVLRKNNIPIVHSIHDYRLICPAYTFVNNNGEICERCKNGNYLNCITNKCSKGSILQSMVMTAEMYYRNLFYDAVNYFDGIIYVSEFSKKIHQYLKPKLKSVESIVLYNSFSKKDKFTDEKENYYLYFGRLSGEKGLKTLLEAFKKNRHLNLKIAGTGPLAGKLSQLIKVDNLTNVDLLGYIGGIELFHLISKAKFVILPSEWYENNPMSLIESYAYGTPVIGAKIGGIPEILIDEKTGFTFESGNVVDLVKVLNYTEKISIDNYNKLSSEAQDFYLKNFDENKYYTTLISFYKLLKTK